MKVLLRVSLAILTALVLIFSWALIEPYTIDQKEITATLPNLPESWAEKRVALLADFQVGMWLGNTWTAARIVNRLIEAQPAAVLIAGDFVYHPKGDASAEISKAVNLVKPLVEAGIPTYAVLGNHDYQMPTAKAPKDEALAQKVVSALTAAGVEVLQNEAIPLRLSGDAQPLYIAGLGSYIADESNPQAALAQVPADAPRLWLMHHPSSFLPLPAGSAPLALSAHTHGGQFRLPFTPEWSWMTFSEEDTVHADGWADNFGAANNQIYINRGIGFSVAPLRLNAPPELTLITLRGQTTSASE